MATGSSTVFSCQLTKLQKDELESKINDFFDWKRKLEMKNDRLALESRSDSVCILLACKQCCVGVVSFGRELNLDESVVVL